MVTGPVRLAYYGYKKHYRVKHDYNVFADGTNHINCIENFWWLCKVRLAKFRGVHKFYLLIKECEFRYNYRNKNLSLPANVSSMIRERDPDPKLFFKK